MPVKITGPDGKTYKFPDGTDRAAAVSYFHSKNIMGPEPPAGFTARLGEATGIPTSRAQWQAAQPSRSDIAKTAAFGPAYIAYKQASGYGKNLVNQFREIKNDPNIRNAGGFDDPITRFMLRGVLAPIGGTGVANFGEDVKKGNYSGAGGDALGTLINALLLKRSGGPSDRVATNRLTAAAGKESFAPIEKTMPEIRQAADRGVGQPENMGDFHSVVKSANKTVKGEADAAMAPIAMQQVVPSSIAQSIRDLKAPHMKMTPEGRAEIAHIEAAAKEFEKPWSFASLDSKRMQLNADLSTFENKTPIARYTAKKGNLNTAIDSAVANQIRDVIYPRMDAAVGKPPGYFRALKQRQGSLMQLDSNLKKRVDDLRAQTAEIQGASRFSRENVSAHVGGGGIPRASFYGLTNIIKKRNPLGAANRRVALGFGSKKPPVAAAYTSTLPFRSQLFPNPQEENR